MARSTAKGSETQHTWTMGDLDVIRPSTESSDPLSAWTKVGLTGVFLALATPLVGVSGLWVTALLGQLAAEGLQLSHATLPAFPLEGDWDLRLVYLAALVAMGLRSAVSRLPRPTWLIAGLGPWPWWLLLGGGLWLTTTAALTFEAHVLDIADGTHLVLMSATSAWTMATATWLLASVGHAAIVGLALATRQSRTLGGITAVGGIASMAIATPVLANPEVLDSDDIRRDAPLLGGAITQLDEARRDFRSSMHTGQRPAAAGIPWLSGRDRSTSPTPLPPSGTTPAALPPASGGSTQDPRYTTAECMEELVTRVPGKSLSPLEEVVRNVERRHRGHDFAEDIVHTKLIDICANQPRKNGKPLLHLLQKATGHGIADVFRGPHGDRIIQGSVLGTGHYEPQCLIDGRGDDETSFEDLQHRRHTIEAALLALPDRDERLIRERYFEGHSYTRMAKARNERKDTINRRTTRAVEKLGVQLATLCH